MTLRYATVALLTILPTVAGAQVGADVQQQVLRNWQFEGNRPGMTTQSRPNLAAPVPYVLPPGMAGSMAPSGAPATPSSPPSASCDQAGHVLPAGIYGVRNGQDSRIFVSVIDGGRQEQLTLEPGAFVARVIAAGSPSAIGIIVGNDQHTVMAEGGKTYCIDTRVAQSDKIFTTN